MNICLFFSECAHVHLDTSRSSYACCSEHLAFSGFLHQTLKAAHRMSVTKAMKPQERSTQSQEKEESHQLCVYTVSISSHSLPRRKLWRCATDHRSNSHDAGVGKNLLVEFFAFSPVLLRARPGTRTGPFLLRMGAAEMEKDRSPC